MSEAIELHVTREDCEQAGAYTEPQGCLLCAAIRRQLGATDVEVTPGRASIDGKWYQYERPNELTEWDHRGVLDAYFRTDRKGYGDGDYLRIDQRPSPDHFTPFTLTLTPV